MQTDAFTEALTRSQHALQSHPPVPAASCADGCEVLAQDWWEVKEDGELRGEVWWGWEGAECTGLCLAWLGCHFVGILTCG